MDPTEDTDTYLKSDMDDQYDRDLGSRTKSDFELSSRLNQFSFLCFGIGYMLPWNAMLAAMDYFTEEFPSYKPSFSLLVAVSAPMLIVQAIVFFFLQYLPLHFKLTTIFATLSMIVVLYALVPTLIVDESTAYWIIISLAVLLGACMAIL